MSIRIALNGFGRIGRNILRTAWNDPEITFVHINDLTNDETLAHLLQYDTVHGKFEPDVKVVDGGISIDGTTISTSDSRDPATLPWAEKSVDIVLECTGIFRSQETAGKHIQAGAKRVIISAPAKDPDRTICIGVNDEDLQASDVIISNASCTTNCLAPVVKVLNKAFGLENGLITTVHSYTMDQRLLDAPHSDLRRGRAAASNMVPTTTGAAKAVGLVLPELDGKLNGMAIRVPTPNVSLVDLVFQSTQPVSVESINQALRDASNSELKGVLGYTDKPLVSSDFVGDPNSSIVDGLSTQIMGNHMAKVIAWYDNEWGFSNRMIDLAKRVTTLG